VFAALVKVPDTFLDLSVGVFAALVKVPDTFLTRRHAGCYFLPQKNLPDRSSFLVVAGALIIESKTLRGLTGIIDHAAVGHLKNFFSHQE
jgi:hypothetical protein